MLLSPCHTWYSRATAHSCEPAAADWSRYCTSCKRIGQTSVLAISVQREQERVPAWVSHVDTFRYRQARFNFGLASGRSTGTLLMNSGPLCFGGSLTITFIRQTDIVVCCRIETWSFQCMLAGFVLFFGYLIFTPYENWTRTIWRPLSGQCFPISETAVKGKW